MLELAETEATGVPELTFKNPNLAEVVAVLPIKTSKLSLIGEMAPVVIRQLELPPPVSEPQVKKPDPSVSKALQPPPPLVKSVRIIWSTALRVISVSAPVVCRIKALLSIVTASPPSPRVTVPLASKAPAM